MLEKLVHILKKYKRKGNVYEHIEKDEELDKLIPQLERWVGFPIRHYRILKGENPKLYLYHKSFQEGLKLYNEGIVVELNDKHPKIAAFVDFAHLFPPNTLPLERKRIEKNAAKNIVISIGRPVARAVEGIIKEYIPEISHLTEALDRVRDTKDALISLSSVDERGFEKSVLFASKNVKDFMDRMDALRLPIAIVAGSKDEEGYDIHYITLPHHIEEELKSIGKELGLNVHETRVIKIPWQKTVYAEMKEMREDHNRLVRIYPDGTILRGVEVNKPLPEGVMGYQTHRSTVILSPHHSFEDLLEVVRKHERRSYNKERGH